MLRHPQVLVATTLLPFLWIAVVEGNNNNPNNNVNNIPGYTIHQQISIDSTSAEDNDNVDTSLLFSYSSDDDEESYENVAAATAASEDNGPSILSSAQLYEGGSMVSTEAMTCHGGDLATFEMNQLLTEYDGNFMGYNVDDDEELMDFEEDVSSDDEEDNDDDNDGHSSMLSNASIRRRNRVVALGSSSTSNVSNNHGSTGRRRRRRLPSQAQQVGSSAAAAATATSSALLVRGGGASMGSEFGKRLMVAALVTLIYEGILGHFLEFIKIVMQTAPPGTGYGDVFKMITAEKGIAGIWDGFVPWGVVQAVAKGGVFGLAHAIATSLLVPLADDRHLLPKQAALTMAGGIAGGFQGFVLSPTLLLKTRVMTNPVFREKMSLVKTTWLSLTIGADVVAHEGILALMKGAKIFATKRVFDWATRYYFSDLFESLMVSHKGGVALTAMEKITASLLGGTASTISTLPLDVLVAKTQDAKKAGVKVSPFQMFKDELEEVGWSGLRKSYMNGFEARLAHVCLTTVVMKTGSPIVYDYLYGGSK
mmetsp:Transcript_7212/g.10977  ORF Transcript_7212/g.10977 Transcript_7212/m.10977 type:complete len:537 (-) Transcript_7212:227-1837(-)|eukprot:CAMPEP_0195288710 /NCGR_PEP_ID=MMETSP0707-20130614/5267_1 /TAXON_ID=33640 /ORGANISM="Asterionellopsis glacialis, Strain CCMP134" /LENGTH=536 /DNA_ID=CAMNT_0040348609 /DNA_START=130 /DNA_END=1740 /DNA_ORIENTATION=-